MLGRRLLVLMAVLLGLTALATSLAPRPGLGGRGAAPAPSQTPARGPSALRPDASRVIARTLVADPGRVPAVVRARVGDTVQLSVKGDVLDSVELVGLDQISTLEPGSPARFELLADAKGRFGIRLLDADRSIGRLEVRAG